MPVNLNLAPEQTKLLLILLLILGGLGVFFMLVRTLRPAPSPTATRKSRSGWGVGGLILLALLVLASLYYRLRVDTQHNAAMEDSAHRRLEVLEVKRREIRRLDASRTRTESEAAARSRDSLPAAPTPPAVPALPDPPRVPATLAPQTPATVLVPSEGIPRPSLDGRSRDDDFDAWKAADVFAGPTADKPWVATAAGSTAHEEWVLGQLFRGRKPGPEGRIVGYSALEPGLTEAAAGARNSAARSVRALIARRIAESRAFTSGSSLQSALAAFEPFILRFVDSGTIDEHDEAVRTQHTAMYRRAILVDCDDEDIRALAEALSAAAKKDRADLILMAVSGMGLAFLIFLLYAFLNAGTKGHFAWPLRLLSLGALVLLFLVLMYFQGWLPR